MLLNLIRHRLWQMTMAVFLLVGMLVAMPGVNQAEAANVHELNYFNYETYSHEGRSWLRIELGIKGGEVNYTTDVKELTPKQLHVVLENTSRGKVKSDISLDRKIAKYLTLRQEGSSNLDVMISLNKPVADQAYKVYTADMDRKAKKPYRLVIEIAADKLASEYEVEKPQVDTFEGLQGRKIVLDPGHGGSDSGAVGPHGLKEKDVALAISKNMADILRTSGAVVTMTRDTDVDVYGPLASDHDELQARVDVGNRDAGNQIFVSIHCNAFTSPTAHGTGTYYFASSYRGQLLAESINDAIVADTGLADRGPQTARFYVLKNSNMPAVLIETAFISNYQEEALLGDEEFQYKIAAAICKGISQYFRMK